MKEMKEMPFTMLSDTNRQVYKSVGLIASFSKTWNAQALTYYAEMKVAGRKLPSAFEGIADDPNQMGGDVVVTMRGIASLVHLSSTPTDRPDVKTLIRHV